MQITWQVAAPANISSKYLLTYIASVAPPPDIQHDAPSDHPTHPIAKALEDSKEPSGDMTGGTETPSSCSVLERPV